ncbi:sugar phosphate isomerase/epimerase family protein [Verrucomicrobiota bacterium sgz303538]
MRLLSSVIAVVLTAASASAADPVAPFHGTAGLQLYSLRESFKTDVPGTLDKVKSLGIREVETATTYGLTAEEFRKQLEARGLTPISGHFQYDQLTTDIAGVIRDAKALGLKYVACPWIPHDIGNFTDADVHRAAADFNKWGEALKKEGLIFAYHPHGYEFRPHSDGTLFDLLIQETKPEFVAFEMDVFWVVHPGQNPVKLMEKYPNRWVLMHLKDIRKGARTGVYTGRTDKSDDVALGTGMVNWPDVLAAAHKVGVKHYFLEDESPTVENQLPKSLQYLESLKAK